MRKMKMESCRILVFTSFMLVPTSTTMAQSRNISRWSVQFGPAYVGFHEAASLAISGKPAPGAGVKLQNNVTLAAEISYRFTPGWSAGLTIGVPVRTRVTGMEAAETFGEMGSGRYGPMAFTIRCNFNDFGRWHPYIGAGLTYFVVLKEYDSFIKNLAIDNAFGSVVQVGLQYDIDSRLGLFFDAKKLFVKTSATGTLPALGSAPVSADVRLDPMVVHMGISYRY